jgi:hypothetical protein
MATNLAIWLCPCLHVVQLNLTEGYRGLLVCRSLQEISRLCQETSLLVRELQQMFPKRN